MEVRQKCVAETTRDKLSAPLDKTLIHPDLVKSHPPRVERNDAELHLYAGIVVGRFRPHSWRRHGQCIRMKTLRPK